MLLVKGTRDTLDVSAASLAQTRVRRVCL